MSLKGVIKGAPKRVLKGAQKKAQKRAQKGVLKGVLKGACLKTAYFRKKLVQKVLIIVKNFLEIIQKLMKMIDLLLSATTKKYRDFPKVPSLPQSLFQSLQVYLLKISIEPNDHSFSPH